MRDRIGCGSIPEQLMQHLELDEKDMEIFGLTELMPTIMKQKGRQPSILNRVVNVDLHKLSSGTAMAKYGDQQNLPFTSLEKYGILGELLGSGNHVRFIAPIEILLCLGCSEMTVIPRNNLLSWRIFGNAIHEFHALVGLITAWNFKQYEHSQPQLPMKTLLLRHQSRCWVANQLRVEEDPDVPGLLYVSQTEQCEPTCTNHNIPTEEAEVDVHTDSKRRKIEHKPDPFLTLTHAHEEVLQTEIHGQVSCDSTELSKEELDFCQHFKDKPFMIELWKVGKLNRFKSQPINQTLNPDQTRMETKLEMTETLLDLQYDLLAKVTFEENEDDLDIPCSQTLEDTYITAVQVHDPSQSTSDIEVFRVTPEQDVEDWILAKVSLEGSQIQFNAPKKNGKMGVSGRICLYVACYDFVLGFNVSSLPLMFYVVGFLGQISP